MDSEMYNRISPEKEDTYIVKRKASPFADSPYEAVGLQEPVVRVKKYRRKSVCIWKQIGALILAAAVLTGACLITAASVRSGYEQRISAVQTDLTAQIAQLRKDLEQSQTSQPQQLPQGSIQLPDGELLTPGQVYAQNAAAVVAVLADVEITDIFGTSSGKSSGSGFLVSPDGYVVTNNHVIADATSQSVQLFDGKKYDAKIIGSDSKNDIALLKIDGENLPWVSFGSSNALSVGDQVVAIGHPLGGKSASLTVGYVSAKDVLVSAESASVYMLQTDAAINSGNSGGPLFNMRGEVVGITTSKYSGYSSSGASIEGMGFALPSDDITPMLADLGEYGYVTGAYLGVYVRNMDVDSMPEGTPAGVFVEDAMSGYAAEKAGIQDGDIIVTLDGDEIDSVTDLSRTLRSYAAGDTVTVQVWRDGQYLDIDVLLDEKPQEDPPTQDSTEPTEPSLPSEPENEATMPQDGDFWEWFEYLKPFYEEKQK